MSGINTGKVVVGGVVAAIVFFAIDAVTWGVIMREASEANVARLGLDPAAMQSPAAMAGWVVSELVWGFLVVFTYAAMRPRFGPGPKTAMYAGLVPYVAVFTVMFTQAQTGMMPMTLMWQGAFFALVSLMAGSVAGAWVYREG